MTETIESKERELNIYKNKAEHLTKVGHSVRKYDYVFFLLFLCVV